MYTKLKIFAFLAIFSLSIIALSLVTTVIAQEPETWSDVTNISNTLSSSTYPDIVTDPYGYIHIFWGENLDGPPVDPKQLGQEQSNAIVYIRGDNQTWSQPIDLFFTAAGGGYRFPSVDIDSSARLHLVWRSGSGIHYSSAPALQAGNAQVWQTPQFLAPAQAQEPARILVDENDIIHLVYSAWKDTQREEKDGNVYYIQSKDGGQTWSDPIQLSEVSPATETNASSYDIAVDTQNHVHVVWQHSDPPGFTGSSVHYISSDDGGRSWSAPTEMARLQGEDNWASGPAIYALPPTEIHLTWVCGDLPIRCHSWSQDGGLTWFPKTKLFGNMHSMAGRDVLTVDGNGDLYWFAQLRYPNAIYYSRWLGGRWTDLQMAHGGLLQGGHYSKASVSRGNQINLVTVEQEMKEIYYFQGAIADPVIEPLPTPKLTPTPTITPLPTSPPVAVKPTPTPRIIPTFDADAPSADGSSPARAIWIGLTPPLLVIGGVLAIQLLRKS